MHEVKAQFYNCPNRVRLSSVGSSAVSFFAFSRLHPNAYIKTPRIRTWNFSSYQEIRLNRFQDRVFRRKENSALFSSEGVA